MITFATILPQLAALCTKLTGLQPVTQRDMPQHAISGTKKGRMVYAVTNVTSIGLDDDVRYVYDSGSNGMVVTVFGIREFTFSVRFEGLDHTADRDALFYLERLRTRLIWPSSQDALIAIGASLTKRLAFQDLSRILSAEDRVNSIGVLDLVFQAVVEDSPSTPTDDSPISWIQTVNWHTNTLNNEGNVPLVKQISDTITVP